MITAAQKEMARVMGPLHASRLDCDPPDIRGFDKLN